MKRLLFILLASAWACSPVGYSQSDALKAASENYQELKEQGRYREAIPYAQEALALAEEKYGPGHPDVALGLNNLAELYIQQGRYSEAEPLMKRVLAIREKVLGPEHPSVATSLNNLAELYRAQGRYDEAEPLLKRSLAIIEKARGPWHTAVALGLNKLASLYQTQGRYNEAEPLLKRSLAIEEKVFGPEHSRVAYGLRNLALLYKIKGRYSEAEPLLKRALAIKEKALDPEHPSVATSLNNLAQFYYEQGSYGEAELLYERSLAIYEKALGPEHPDVATSLNNLAELYGEQGRYDEAEPLHKRSLAITEKVLGPEHPDVAIVLNNLALFYDKQGRYDEALDHIRRATAIHRKRMAVMVAIGAGAEDERRSVAPIFEAHTDIASKVMTLDQEQRDTLTGESFEVAQLAHAASVGAAISHMAARFAAGDDTRLAGIVRGRQDALRYWRRLDEELVKAAGKLPGERNKEKESLWRAKKEKLTASLEELDGRLAQEYPEYTELTPPRPMPVSLAAVQELLGPDEALIAYMVNSDRTYLWALRADRAEQFMVEGVGRERLERYVTLIRKALDPEIRGNFPDFDVAEASELYRAIFAPAKPLLEGARHVMVAPDGALQSLPLGVLVTSLPENGVSDYRNYRNYRKVAWLAKEFAITTLPTVSSLRALRKFAKVTKASDPFTGFGDPLLSGSEGNARGVEVASLFRGTIADVDKVRELDSLQNAAAELRQIADYLGGKEEDLYLRDRATETMVKEIILNQSKVLAFATHGLISGQLKGLSEPALVLTPPARGTEVDDGLLTASEIAQLKLDADFVILSACNTASADKPEAEGLSGLAKAFFYAGARSLLVSHWPVESSAAAKLTTRMFDELKADPGIGRSEALRRSMMDLEANDDNPLFAHPRLWAPFVVVGEGDARR